MLKAIVDRFEGDFAILTFDDGQKLNWPTKNLPKDIKEGSVIWLTASSDKETTKKQQALAKEIINEILKKE